MKKIFSTTLNHQQQNKIQKVRQCFKISKKLRQEIIQQNIPNIGMKELSMGLSGDLETAIEEGATIVRMGTAVFGTRIYPDSYYWDEGKFKS
jgi:uncharacterized pyridoxal phosphate-containing UPF0001 family protein